MGGSGTTFAGEGVSTSAKEGWRRVQLLSRRGEGGANVFSGGSERKCWPKTRPSRLHKETFLSANMVSVMSR